MTSHQAQHTPTSTLPPGTLFEGRYRVEEIIGHGKAAVVYRATQLNIKQAIALKLLHIKPRDGFEQRFDREVRAATQIQHPDVVRVFDFGLAQGRQPYIAMELLRGHTLSQELDAHGPLEVERAIGLFVRCLDALQAAHARGIIHRDIKPDNLFLVEPRSQVETLKLLDFGVAHIMASQARLTSPGELFGNPQYLAPEYVQSQVVSPALDVYQMGLVLVEALCGVPVVDAGSDMESMMRHCRGELNIPESIRNSPLWACVSRALSADHTRRLKSAGALRDALSAISADVVEYHRVQPIRHRSPNATLPSSGVRFDGLSAALGSTTESPQIFKGGSASLMTNSGSFPHLGATTDLPRLDQIASQAASVMARPSPSGQLRRMKGPASNSDDHAATIVDFSPPDSPKKPDKARTGTIVDFSPPPGGGEATEPEGFDSPSRPAPARKSTVPMDKSHFMGAEESEPEDLTHRERKRPPLHATVNMRALDEDASDPDETEPGGVEPLQEVARRKPTSKPPAATPAPSPSQAMAAPIPQAPSPIKSPRKKRTSLFLMALLGVVVLMLLSAAAVLVLLASGIIGSGFELPTETTPAVQEESADAP